MDQNRETNMTPEDAGSSPTAYSDAYYRSAPEQRRSCYGYSPAQCYARASEAEDAPAPPSR